MVYPNGKASRIAEVSLARVNMPFAEGEWKFALGTTSVKSGLLIRIVDEDGRQGIGYSGETLHDGEALAVIEGATRYLATALPGRQPEELYAILDIWDRMLYGNRRTKAGLELALWDLIGHRAAVPAHTLLSSGVSKADTEVEVVRIVPLGSPDEMAEHAHGLCTDGYRYLKVKASGPISLDVRRLEAIRQRVGAEPGLVVDANQSMRPKEAVTYCAATRDLGVDIFEQPVHRDDVEGLRFVRERVEPLVEADEGAATIERVVDLIRRSAVDSVSIKLPKLGGLVRSLRVAEVCAAAGIGYRIGATFGSRLYAAANMQFLAAAPPTYACEVGEFEHLLDDPVEGVDVVAGRLKLTAGPGLGLTHGDLASLPWDQIGR